MAKFSLVDGVNRLSTEVAMGDASVVLEAGQAYETDDPAVMAVLRANDNVVEDSEGS